MATKRWTRVSIIATAEQRGYTVDRKMDCVSIEKPVPGPCTIRLWADGKIDRFSPYAPMPVRVTNLTQVAWALRL